MVTEGLAGRSGSEELNLLYNPVAEGGGRSQTPVGWGWRWGKCFYEVRVGGIGVPVVLAGVLPEAAEEVDKDGMG